MKRLIIEKLMNWYSSADRKPLVLRGARQVGKTFAVDQFGKNNISGNYHYIDFKEDSWAHTVFEETSNPKEILDLIQIKKNIKIDIDSDLLFLDEIQECSSAIGSLKYFEKHMKNFSLIVAGSHLGLLKNEDSFPVGRVNFLSMFPMTFYEFIMALDDQLVTYLDRFNFDKPEKIPTVIHNKLLELVNLYFAVGGLPDAVFKFKQLYKINIHEALASVRSVQKELLLGYQADFSKYSGVVNANHIQHVFSSIPKQLAKNYDEEVKKYKFSGVIPKQKGFERIVGPLTWLCKSRLSIKSFVAKKSAHPLLAYTDDNLFKLFFFDVGLLCAALETPMDALIVSKLDNYKGYIVENFIAQEIFANLDSDLISWKEGEAEIEFLITRGDMIIPLEVKSSKKYRRSKSLNSYVTRYSPEVAYKISAKNVGRAGNVISLPFYLIGSI